jgi:putative endopeptidase
MKSYLKLGGSHLTSESVRKLNSSIFSSCIPQNDLDCFYNSDWKEKHSHHDKKSINNFLLTQDKINDEISGFVNSLEYNSTESTATTVVNKLVDFRNSFDTRNIDVESMQTIRKLIHMINSITNITELINVIIYLNSFKIYSLFTLHIASHHIKPDIYTLYIGEVVLSLEDNDSYKDTSKLWKLYTVLIEAANFLSKDLLINVDQFVQDIMIMEIICSNYVYNLEETLDVELVFNSTSKDKFIDRFDLTSICHNNFWKIIFGQFENLEIVMFENPRYLNFLKTIISAAYNQDNYLRILKHFIMFSVIKKYGMYMPIGSALMSLTPFGYDIDKIFSSVIQHYFGYYLEEQFEKKYSDPDKMRDVYDMFVNIKEYCRTRLLTTSMFSEYTKKEAVNKIQLLDVIIGAQDYRVDLNLFPKLFDNDFYGNLMKMDYFYLHNSLNLIGKSKNRKWLSTNHDTYSFHVNAYYIPQYNMIYLPTSVLTDIFYKYQTDPIYNYGGLGSFIGHEIIHCFDKSGAMYDHLGCLHNWWSPTDYAVFQEELNKIINHYDKLTIQKISTNARTTIRENIADIVGLKLSLRSYIHKHITDEYIMSSKYSSIITNRADHLKKFFYRWAEVFRSISKTDYLDYMSKTDPHSPSTIRINAPLSHLYEYYLVFNVNLEHHNYLEESKRCKFLD